MLSHLPLYSPQKHGARARTSAALAHTHLSVDSPWKWIYPNCLSVNQSSEGTRALSSFPAVLWVLVEDDNLVPVLQADFTACRKLQAVLTTKHYLVSFLTAALCMWSMCTLMWFLHSAKHRSKVWTLQQHRADIRYRYKKAMLYHTRFPVCHWY